MLKESPSPVRGRDDTSISRDELALAMYGDDGIYVRGRHVELENLRAMGARDPSLGRIYEGHCNGAQIVALYGTHAQRERATSDIRDGALFGVWNTQADEPVTIRETREPGHYRLSGAKTWASGADVVDRALITAKRADGRVQMCLVPMERVRFARDSSQWHPLGMDASNSIRMPFDGVELTEADLIGEPDVYTRDPWFFGGALRFVAVHSGIAQRLAEETFDYLASRNRMDDPLTVARAGEMRIALGAAHNWVAAGEAAWLAFDRDRSDAAAARVVDTVDMARLGVERCALDIMERAIRAVGASGLLEPLPFAGLVKDLTMYLRQPAPDAILARIGKGAFAARS